MIWHHETPEDVAKELMTNVETGLSEEEATTRLKEFGHNHYHQKPDTPFFRQLQKRLRSLPMTLITLASIVLFCIDLLLWHFGRSAVIWEPFVLLLLPVIGHLVLTIWQKIGTTKLHHLKNAQTTTVAVLRDGEYQIISTADIVRGDIIKLESGMIVPADCRLIEADELFCDEYVITGEDTDIAKNAAIIHEGITPLPDRSNMIYAGCGISRGSCTAVVVSIAKSTEYALMLNDPDNQSSPLPGISKDIATFERLVTLPVFALSLIVLVVGILRNLGDVLDILTIIPPVLAMAAIAIPAGLTVGAVVAMTMGMHHVVNRSADVRDLSVMDTLSRVTVICADKTGVLTSDEKRPVGVYTGEEETLTRMPSNRAQTLIRLATLCTASDTELTGIDHHLVSNPTESAIIEYARDIGIERRLLMEDSPRLAEIPFDTTRRCMSVLHLIEGHRIMITMGAPESVISLCTSGPLEHAEEANLNMATQSLRVLAVAYKYLDDSDSSELDASQECDMVFAGLIALADEARDESVAAIAECRAGGIITVMITGDNEETAKAVATNLGILTDDNQLLTGDKLSEMDQEELDSSVGMYRVFARILPEDKERIIRAWQRRGAVVAATGNCLADVPALQCADIGCATGAADCDMTRNESDLTMYDNSFASLVDAIKQARGIYSNIRKILQYALTGTVALIATILVGLIGYGEFVLSAPAMALYFLIGSLCMMAISYEAGDRHALGEKPHRGLARLVPTSTWIDTLWQGALMAICTIVAFDTGAAGTPNSADIELTLSYGVTTAFITLFLSRLWLTTTYHRHDSEHRHFANRKMPLMIFISLAVLAIVLFISPIAELFGLTYVGAPNWVLALILSLIPATVAFVVRFVKQMLTAVRKVDESL